MSIPSAVPAAVLQWQDFAEKYAALRPGLLPIEILAIIWEESTGDPNAVNPNDPSYGLMGIEMPIAAAYGKVTNSDELYEPDINIQIGSAFLYHLKTQYASAFPNWITGYNEGETQLREGRPDPAYLAAFNAHVLELEAALYPHDIIR